MENNINNEFMSEFLDQLLEKAWFWPEDDLELLTTDLETVLLDTIITKTALRLNEEQHEHIWALMKDWKTNEVNSYIRTSIPNYDEFLADIYIAFEKDYLSEF